MASSSKTFLLLGFMFALVILISSEVSARELVEITKPVTTIGEFLICFFLTQMYINLISGGRALKPGPVFSCGRNPYSKCLPKPRGHGPPAPGPGRV
ncbi:unnamed protein product [Prunus brigantina]